jgi:hypothetical protein
MIQFKRALSVPTGFTGIRLFLRIGLAEGVRKLSE